MHRHMMRRNKNITATGQFHYYIVTITSAAQQHSKGYKLILSGRFAYPYVFMFVCVRACLSACQSVRLTVCLFFVCP